MEQPLARNEKSKCMNVFLWIGFICLTFFLTVQSVNSPISKNYAYSDYSVYQYVASIMSEGGMPYRDTFDHKGPVFYLINELGFVMHPKYGMWMIDFLLMFGTLVYAYRISRTRLSEKLSFFIAATALSGISAWGYWIGNTPDTCVLFFLMMTMYFFVMYAECQSLTNGQIFMTGVSCAAALLMKPTFLAMPAVLILVILFQSVKQKDFVFLRRCVCLFSIPFFGIVVGCVVWLGVNGALMDCIEQYLIFNTKYSGVKNGLSDYLHVLKTFLEKPSTLLGLFCIWVNVMRWNEYTDGERRLLRSTYLVWAVVFYVSVIPGRAYQQYTAVYYPMILVIVTFAFKDIDRFFREENDRKFIGMIAVIMTVVNVLMPNVKQIEANIRSYTAEAGLKVQVVNFFNDRPGAYEIAVVSPDDNWVYLQTGHRSATKYSYTQAALIYEGIKSDFIKEYSEAVNESRPLFIVESSRSNLFTLKIAENLQCKYVEVFRNDGYVVYELSES